MSQSRCISFSFTSTPFLSYDPPPARSHLSFFPARQGSGHLHYRPVVPPSSPPFLLQLAKAVANSTSATFLRVVGSELIQKYLGDGPKLVRELFRIADESSPSIVFIDEIDAVGTKVRQCLAEAGGDVKRAEG